MDEKKRIDFNTQRLTMIDLSIRSKVAEVLQELEELGERPLIHHELFRTQEEQIAIFHRGDSQVTWSYHCATDKDGNPATLAADIVDANYDEGASHQFWMKLGHCAMKRDLEWGGLWGLPQDQRQNIRDLTADCKWDADVELGWDKPHIQTTEVTLAEAKAGKRYRSEA